MLRYAIVLSFFLICAKAWSGNLDTLYFKEQELKLKQLYAGIRSLEGQGKSKLELGFRDQFANTLKKEESYNYKFDSLSFIGRVISQDEKLIVYTWNIPQNGGFNNYYCIIQYVTKKSNTVTVLNESIGFLNKTRQGFADKNNWPGALYYEVVNTKHKGKSYYTLIGYDFNNLISNRKVIELISINESGVPVFERNGFIYNGRPHNRIVFEYAERVQMQLSYSEKEDKIIFDHLSPFKPSLEDQYQFYGPDFSYDGLVFKDGKWEHESDIQPQF